MLMLSAVTCLTWAATALASPARMLESRDAPTVKAPAGTILGKADNGVETFSGIPFAQPPVGPLRMKPPVRRNGSLGEFDGTKLAPACPQMLVSSDSKNILLKALGSIANLPFVQDVTGQTEDCLTVTVSRPAGTAPDAKLPVLFWIFGGGFELGWSSMYDGTSLLNQAIDIKQPFIFVAVNYRVAGYGFMPGKEIMAEGSGNAGLLDQRMALEWVADNIAAFGGDPDKVTIWGESAGSISVFNHMILYDGDNKYNGKPLFRAGIMDSGSVLPTDPLDCPKGQAVFDKVVSTAGCSGSDDKLACLRDLSSNDFLKAVNSAPGILSYNSLALSYMPRPDGKVITQSPDALVTSGKYAAVPMIIGDQEDEGTLFAIFQPLLITSDLLAKYFTDYYFAGASKDQIKELIDTYGSGLKEITDNSPFNTGLLNDITPGFKRRAAMLGDLGFTLARRLFLEMSNAKNPDVPSWSYLASYDHGTPILGTFHATDILQVFFGVKDNYAANSLRTYYSNFVHNLDPNVGVSGKYPNWERWSTSSSLMNFAADSSKLEKDDFRQDSYDWIKSNINILKL